jgi:tetratricopeptide (TPR) repeat protein
MAGFDRETALKTAEKALRLGKIDAAIAEYVRIVEAQPRDWNSANALGDLYVRANRIDQGVAQYTRIADHLAREGFFPKAAALYKKILKVKPGDEAALLQTGDLAAKQGLLADAKNAFLAVAEKCRARGDKKAAAEVDVRLGRLDPDDLESRLRGARAASELGDTAAAVQEFHEIALALHTKGNPGAALEVLAEIAALDPSDLQVRGSLARGYAAAGDLERARQYLDAQTAGDSAPLWLTLAEIELTSERLDEGRAAVDKALTIDPAIREAVVALGTRLSSRSAEAAYQCIDAVATRAAAAQEFALAATALQEFVGRVPHHLIALMRLVEVCVDGGLETTMYEAQAQLADAYLEAGRALEARIISEDLVGREPSNQANIDRFRRALVILGEKDPDTVIAERLSGESPFLATDDLDLNEGTFFADAEPDTPAVKPAASPVRETSVPDPVRAGALPSTAPPAAAHPQPAAPPPRSLDQVFSELRDEVSQGPDEEAAAEQFALAVTYQDLGMVDDAIEALQQAARSPRQRFEAGSLLGRLYRERGEAAQAVEWFERAAEAPPTSADAGRTLLYDLADTLESVGEHSRALAVFVELEAESNGFRDVTKRIDRLSTIQAKAKKPAKV